MDVSSSLRKSMSFLSEDGCEVTSMTVDGESGTQRASDSIVLRTSVTGKLDSFFSNIDEESNEVISSDVARAGI